MRRLPLLNVFLVGMLLSSLIGCGGGDGEKDAPAGKDSGPHTRVSNGNNPRAKLTTAKYVGREACIKCHAEQAHEWKGSHHDLAMDLATPETVVADFGDTSFEKDGVTTRFFMKDGKHFVNTDGPDGKMTDFEVKYVLGVEPLQQYMVEFPDGRIQCLGIAWDVEGKRWYHLYPKETIPHTDVLHWTKPAQNWNLMCAECHTTNLQKNYDPDTDTYKTSWTNMDVSCEACHGPGSEHEAWANKVGAKGGEYYGNETDFKLTIDLKPRDVTDPKAINPTGNRTQVEACAPCHSHRSIVTPGHHAGRKFDDHYFVHPLTEPLYESDGQINDEVYVYGSFIQSKMFHKGVRCTDCHNAHTTKVYVQGNALCIRCHEPGKFDVEAHHHHPPMKDGTASKGAQCVNCHMVEKTYMGVDPRRDHGFHIPRPDLTVSHGIRNACNNCHKDKEAKWAADQVVKWYGEKRPTDPHFAPIFAAVRNGQPEAEQGLVSVLMNVERPGIVRATAAAYLSGFGSQESIAALTAALKASDPIVRRAAVSAAAAWPDQMIAARLTPLLSDPVQLVRTETARVLARIANQVFADRSTSEAGQFWAALEDYLDGQRVNQDRGSALINIGQIHHALGELDDAEKAYRRAIRLEPYFAPAYLRLAVVLNQKDDNVNALVWLRKAVEQAGDHVDTRPVRIEANYYLGMLLGEIADGAEKRGQPATARQHYEASAEAFGRAAAEAQNNPRMFFNQGVALLKLDRLVAAEAALERAMTLQQSQDIANALGSVYGAQMNKLALEKKWNKALYYGSRLQQLFPQDRNIAKQIEALRREASRQSN